MRPWLSQLTGAPDPRHSLRSYRGRMQIPRNPRRGLVAGMVALSIFSSSAVAMTAGVSISGPVSLAQTLTAQAAGHGHDGGGHRGGGHDR